MPCNSARRRPHLRTRFYWATAQRSAVMNLGDVIGVGLVLYRALRRAGLRLPVSVALLAGLLPGPVLSRHPALTPLFSLATLVSGR
jgi:hypothetical protein